MNKFDGGGFSKMNIYQEIWNADQEDNGVKPVLNENQGDPNSGYVVVNEQPITDQALNLFTKIVIPDSKKKSYELCRKLFNNYTLSPNIPEQETQEEMAEIQELLEYIVDSKPMLVARAFMEKQTGKTYSSAKWYKILMDVWFAQFSQTSGKDLSGFEHVVVGEQKQGKVSGYHFWYKYYLDDSNELLNSDDIEYLGLKGNNQSGNMLVPEVSTLSYKWDAFDYDAQKYRPLYKKIGGFFNGCSVEGLMALGTVRFLGEGRAPKEAVINNALYNMKVFRSSNGKHMRTFYPEFVQLESGNSPSDLTEYDTPTVIVTDPQDVVKSTGDKMVKIIAALVNPVGEDAGFESITLLNTSPNDIDLNHWLLEDKNNKQVSLNMIIKSGETLKIRLSGLGSPQLSNKGGSIILINNKGAVVDKVAYTKTQAQKIGWTIVF